MNFNDFLNGNLFYQCFWDKSKIETTIFNANWKEINTESSWFVLKQYPNYDLKKASTSLANK